MSLAYKELLGCGSCESGLGRNVSPGPLTGHLTEWASPDTEARWAHEVDDLAQALVQGSRDPAWIEQRARVLLDRYERRRRADPASPNNPLIGRLKAIIARATVGPAISGLGGGGGHGGHGGGHGGHHGGNATTRFSGRIRDVNRYPIDYLTVGETIELQPGQSITIRGVTLTNNTTTVQRYPLPMGVGGLGQQTWGPEPTATGEACFKRQCCPPLVMYMSAPPTVPPPTVVPPPTWEPPPGILDPPPTWIQPPPSTTPYFPRLLEPPQPVGQVRPQPQMQVQPSGALTQPQTSSSTPPVRTYPTGVAMDRGPSPWVGDVRQQVQPSWTQPRPFRVGGRWPSPGGAVRAGMLMNGLGGGRKGRTQMAGFGGIFRGKYGFDGVGASSGVPVAGARGSGDMYYSPEALAAGGFFVAQKGPSKEPTGEGGAFTLAELSAIPQFVMPSHPVTKEAGEAQIWSGPYQIQQAVNQQLKKDGYFRLAPLSLVGERF